MGYRVYMSPDDEGSCDSLSVLGEEHECYDHGSWLAIDQAEGGSEWVLCDEHRWLLEETGMIQPDDPDGTVLLPAEAYIRMRGEEWTMAPDQAEWLSSPSMGVLWRDYDCEENTRQNDPDGVYGPCYGIVGESESDEEHANRLLVERWGTPYVVR